MVQRFQFIVYVRSKCSIFFLFFVFHLRPVCLVFLCKFRCSFFISFVPSLGFLCCFIFIHWRFLQFYFPHVLAYFICRSFAVQLANTFWSGTTKCSSVQSIHRSLFALFAVRFAAVFSGWNSVSVTVLVLFFSVCYFFILIFLSRNFFYLLFYFQPTPWSTVQTTL